MTKRVPISFEFFPPKTDAGAEKLKIVHQELQLLKTSMTLMVKAQRSPLTFLVSAMIKVVLLNS